MFVRRIATRTREPRGIRNSNGNAPRGPGGRRLASTTTFWRYCISSQPSRAHPCDDVLALLNIGKAANLCLRLRQTRRIGLRGCSKTRVLINGRSSHGFCESHDYLRDRRGPTVPSGTGSRVRFCFGDCEEGALTRRTSRQASVSSAAGFMPAASCAFAAPRSGRGRQCRTGAALTVRVQFRQTR